MREIRMLRAMWRELETGPRSTLPGHEGGNPGDRQGSACGLPRQLSTLPFRRRRCKVRKTGELFVGFAPAVSLASLKAMRRRIRKMRVRSRTDLSLAEIASWINPILRGWASYYGAFYRSEMYRLWRHVNKTLVRWAMRKFRHLDGRKTRAVALFERLVREKPGLFAHWERGMVGAFA